MKQEITLCSQKVQKTGLLIINILLLASSISETGAISSLFLEMKLTSLQWPLNTIEEDGTKCKNVEHQSNACNPSMDISFVSQKKTYTLGPFGIDVKYIFGKYIPSNGKEIPNSLHLHFGVKNMDEIKNMSVLFEIYNNGFKDEMITKFNMSLAEITNYPTMNNKFKDVKTVQGKDIEFNFAAKLSCRIHFYGEKCNIFCAETNNENGHYTCDPNGEKKCLIGWTDLSNNCLTKIEKVALEIKLGSLKWKQTSEDISPLLIVERVSQNNKNIINKYVMGPLGTTSPIKFDDKIIGQDGKNIENPIHFGFAYKGSLNKQQMRFIIYKNVTKTDVIYRKEIAIETLAKFSQSQADAEYTKHTLTFEDENGSLEISSRSFCYPNYFGSTCLLYCTPNDNEKGHYDCDHNGKKVCLQGWEDPSKDCMVESNAIIVKSTFLFFFTNALIMAMDIL